MVKAAGLEGLRFHDLRHNANTALAEDPEVSPETRIAIAGHSSLDSNAKYTHPRLEAMRRALQRLELRRAAEEAESEPEAPPEGAEKQDGSAEVVN